MKGLWSSSLPDRFFLLASLGFGRSLLAAEARNIACRQYSLPSLSSPFSDPTSSPSIRLLNFALLAAWCSGDAFGGVGGAHVAHARSRREWPMDEEASPSCDSSIGAGRFKLLIIELLLLDISLSVSSFLPLPLVVDVLSEACGGSACSSP